jgi:hypothetical protein
MRGTSYFARQSARTNPYCAAKKSEKARSEQGDAKQLERRRFRKLVLMQLQSRPKVPGPSARARRFCRNGSNFRVCTRAGTSGIGATPSPHASRRRTAPHLSASLPPRRQSTARDPKAHSCRVTASGAVAPKAAAPATPRTVLRDGG